ncbi:MAG TPA: DUF5074 domain-containing protein [Bacteroidia bacterium]|nr:DUF5074 domain-containing protein [Bacteroidia bacterium]
MKKTVLVASAAILLFGCKKDEPAPPSGSNSASTSIVAGEGALVACEGNFQGGNAKVSYYKFSDGSVVTDLFSTANNRPLGDVCQSISFSNGLAYIVVNNSGKIEEVNPSSYVSQRIVNGFTSPRYMLQVAPGRAYVTDLYANGVWIMNTVNNTISGMISVPGETEAMEPVNGEIFVTSPDRDQLYVINSVTNTITDSITVAKGGNSMVSDANGKLWVLCYGDYFTSAPGGLYRIDPQTHTVEASWPFTTAESPTRLCCNSTRDTLYYIDNDIYRMPVTNAALPSTPFISAGTHSFYGLAVRPSDNELFVTDAVDYVQQGHLLRYTRQGVLTDDKQVGIIPGSIYFY